MIRTATLADLEAIMRIERRSFPTDAWSAEMMSAELASPHGRYFVDVEPDARSAARGAEEQGAAAGAPAHGAGEQGASAGAATQGTGELVVGYGGVRALRGSADADIQTIALDADYRGSGRGRALLGTLLVEAVQRGAREVFLEVRADNPVAQGLYLSEGFVEIGRRAGYYQPDDVDAVIMRLDLRGRRAVLGADSSDRRESEGVGATAPSHPENATEKGSDG